MSITNIAEELKRIHGMEPYRDIDRGHSGSDLQTCKEKKQYFLPQINADKSG